MTSSIAAELKIANFGIFVALEFRRRLHFAAAQPRISDCLQLSKSQLELERLPALQNRIRKVFNAYSFLAVLRLVIQKPNNANLIRCCQNSASETRRVDAIKLTCPHWSFDYYLITIRAITLEERYHREEPPAE